MKRIETIHLKNGTLIKGFPEAELRGFVTYNRAREPITYQIQYVIGENEYILQPVVKLAGPIKDAGKYLPQEHAEKLIREVLPLLRAEGISVDLLGEVQ